jgi:hypothetical protein
VESSAEVCWGERLDALVRPLYDLDSVPLVLAESLGLVREEADRVIRSAALEADGSGDVWVCRFE